MSLRESVETQLKNLEIFAPNAETVLSDPLSELTRKRQLWLLGISLVCVVLSSKVAKLSEASLLGLKFTDAAQPELLFVLKLVCVYFIIVFLASAYQDIKKSHYKALPARAALIRVGLDLQDKNSGELKVVAEAEERLAKITDEFTEILERSSAGFTSEDQKRLLALPILATSASADARHGAETLDSILNKMLDSHPIEMRVRIVRTSVELASPVLLGAYSIWLH